MSNPKPKTKVEELWRMIVSLRREPTPEKFDEFNALFCEHHEEILPRMSLRQIISVCDTYADAYIDLDGAVDLETAALFLLCSTLVFYEKFLGREEREPHHHIADGVHSMASRAEDTIQNFEHRARSLTEALGGSDNPIAARTFHEILKRLIRDPRFTFGRYFAEIKDRSHVRDMEGRYGFEPEPRNQGKKNG